MNLTKQEMILIREALQREIEFLKRLESSGKIADWKIEKINLGLALDEKLSHDSTDDMLSPFWMPSGAGP